METPAGRAELLERWAQAAEATRALVGSLTDDQLDTAMTAGWSPKEMLGHLAFWAECTEAVVVGILRGDTAAIADFRFGSGYVADGNEPWPVDTVHNAREAAWARGQTGAAVVARLERALDVAHAVIGSLTDDEATDSKFVEYVEGSIAHVQEHREELASAIVGR